MALRLRGRGTAVGLTQGGGGGNVLDTLTITNDSGSTQSTGFVTEYFMLKFKRGDLVSGTYPTIANAALSFGTPVPWSSDSSVMLLPCFARISQSVTGSSTASLNISSGGSAPAASSRVAGDLTTGGDLTVEFAIFEGGSGTVTASLDYAIANAYATETFADGDAGKAIILKQTMRTTAPANHGQLECWHYITLHDDASDNFHSGTWMPLLVCPKIGASSPTRIAGSLTVKKGGSTLKSFDSAKTATYAGVANQLTVTGHGWESGEVVKLSTTGLLPVGLSDSVACTIDKIDANTLELYTKAYDGTRLTFSTSGIGTHTITKIVGIDQYGGFYATDTDALPWFVAGTGTRCTTRARQSKAYELSTKLFPPYRDDVAPTTPTELFYAPNTAGQMQRAVGGTGGRPDIAILPEWCAVDFKSRTLISDKNARANGLVAAQFPMWAVNASTGHIIPVDTNSATWSGLGTGDIDFRCRYPTYASNNGCSIASNAFDFFSWHDNSHIAALGIYQWLVHGTPWFRDSVIFSAQSSIVNQSVSERTRTVSAVDYHPVTNNSAVNLLRESAWATREACAAAYLIAPTHPAQPYMLWVVEQSRDSLQLEIATKSADYIADGLRFIPVYPVEAPWTYAYEISVMARVQCWSDQDADWKTLAARGVKFAKRLRVLTGGVGQLVTYRMTRLYNGTDQVRGMSDMAFPTSLSISSINTGTNVITFSNPKSITLANGDRIQWPVDGSSTKPSGVSDYTTYELSNVSGNTAQVVPLGGGSVVSLGSFPGAHDAYMLNANHGNKAQDAINNEPGGYYGVWRAAMCECIAAGTDEANAVDVVTDLDTMYGIDGSGSWADSLKTYMQTSFT